MDSEQQYTDDGKSLFQEAQDTMMALVIAMVTAFVGGAAFGLFLYF